MKLAATAKITVKHAATLQGGAGGPLSELAAQTDEQLATNFPIEQSDKDLAERVLLRFGGPNVVTGDKGAPRTRRFDGSA